MRLEVGKTYRNGYGNPVTIGGYVQEQSCTKDIVWSAQGDWYYADDGAFVDVNYAMDDTGKDIREILTRHYGNDQLVSEATEPEPLELEDLPDFGDVMPLSEWIKHVEEGGFIDYDGYGHYVTKDGKMVANKNKVVRPSHLKAGLIDCSYDLIVWFNR